MTKNLVSGLILAHLAQVRAAIFFFFFFKNLASSFGLVFFFKKLYIMVSYHHVKYQQKLMIQSWKQLFRNLKFQ